MNILFVNHLPAGTASFYRQLDIARALVKKGHHAKMLVRSKTISRGSSHGKIVFYDAALTDIHGIKIYYWNEPFEYLFLLNSYQVIKHCKNVDVIYMNRANPFSTISVFTARCILRRPIVDDLEDWDAIGGYSSMVSNSLVEKFTITFFEELVPRMSECVVVVSGHLYKRVAAMGVPKNRIYYVPNGVDVNLFNPNIDGHTIRMHYGILNDPVIVSLGILYKHETEVWELLIEIMSLLIKKIANARLLLVGWGPELERVKRQVKKLKMEKNVIFTGYVPHDEVPKYIAAADVALYVLDESFHYYSCSPKTIAEFMAMGKTIVAMDIGEVYEALKNGAGILVRGTNPEDYVEPLVQILSEPKTRKIYGEVARSRAVKFYSLEVLSERVERACEKAIEVF